jgi:hypothetical protein
MEKPPVLIVRKYYTAMAKRLSIQTQKGCAEAQPFC